MEQGEMMTREEAVKFCEQMANDLKTGAMNGIKVLHGRVFVNLPEENELMPLWCMAGVYLKDIIDNFNDILEDIKTGRYLPKKEG